MDRGKGVVIACQRSGFYHDVRWDVTSRIKQKAEYSSDWGRLQLVLHGIAQLSFWGIKKGVLDENNAWRMKDGD